MAVPGIVHSVTCGSTSQLAGAGESFLPRIFYIPNGGSLSGNCGIIFVARSQTGGTTSVADDKTNTWVKRANTTVRSVTVEIWAAFSMAAGTSKVTVSFSGTPTGVFVKYSEFYNIGSATDGSGVGNATSGATMRPAAFATTVDGDLIYQVVFCDNFAVSGDTYTADTNFKLIAVEPQVFAVDQWGVQTTHSASTRPQITNSDSGTEWISVAVALLSAAAGNAPPAGIWVNHVQLIPENTGSTSHTWQFPCYGNLLIGVQAFATANNDEISSISDSLNAGNWSQVTFSLSGLTQGVATFYRGNATSGQGLTQTVNFTSATVEQDYMLFDVTGAATSPFDTSAGTNGNQVAFSSPISAGSITPGGSNYLMVGALCLALNGLTGVVNNGTFMPQDENNGWVEYLPSSAAAINMTWGTDQRQQAGGIGDWTVLLATFKPPGAAAPPQGWYGQFGAPIDPIEIVGY